MQQKKLSVSYNLQPQLVEGTDFITFHQPHSRRFAPLSFSFFFYRSFFHLICLFPLQSSDVDLSRVLWCRTTKLTSFYANANLLGLLKRKARNKRIQTSVLSSFFKRCIFASSQADCTLYDFRPSQTKDNLTLAVLCHTVRQFLG